MRSRLYFFLSLLIIFSNLNINAQLNNLLPAPQNAAWGKNKFPVAKAKILVTPDLFYREGNSIKEFAAFVRNTTGITLSITHNDDFAGNIIVLKSDQEGQALPVINEKAGSQSRESYSISVKTNRVQITARTDAGLYYSLQTLRQLIVDEENESYIPEVEIEDFPTLPYRGVMMDVSHGGLLTEQEIKNQIDFLARWKMNQYYFYNEVSIELKGYPLINYNACYSQEQVKRIISYARERHMDVIPFVNFYGHLHELLRVEKYAALGIGQYGHDLDPRNPGVQVFLKEWIKQYADIFPSPFIHVGFDETWETERLTIADSLIRPRDLYIKQLNFVTETLHGYGKKVMVWTDISNNYPDIISEFPKELIPVIWEYSDKPASFSRWLKPLLRENMPFFIQSAVDSWGNVYPANDYTFDNIDLCLKASRDERAIGYITSVWTDAVQPLLRNTWLYMAYGSAGAWQKEPHDRSDFLLKYCSIMYPGISGKMVKGFEKMAESEALLAKCLGRHTLSEMWADPFSSYHLRNTNDHIEDYKNARRAAETALEYLLDAFHAQPGDSAFIKSLMVNARMLNYTAARFIWAKTIVDRWNWIYDLKPNGKKDNNRFYDINYSTHGLTVDMMDWCTELKREYSEAWLSENMTYRMGTITGRFDAEYLLWSNLYFRIVDYRNRNNINNSTLRFEDIFLKSN